MDLGLTSRVGIVAAASTLWQAAAHIQRTTEGEVMHQALDVLDSATVAVFVAAVKARFSIIDFYVTNSRGPASNFLDSTQPKNKRSNVDGGAVRSLT
jgi:NAD(P)-dependent dehydrogenase (short-subunit alcohol dehydrogenase family)